VTAAEPSGAASSAGAFEAAAKAACSLLRDEIAFDVWMVTLLRGDRLVIVAAEDGDLGVEEGDSFPFSDTFCYQMVAGNGPRVAPRIADVPAYANNPYAQGVPASAYIGVPLSHPDGSVAGTLCALSRRAHPPDVGGSLERVEKMGRLLTAVLKAEERANEERLRARRAEEESLVDSLTGISNRRAWDRLLEVEEQRCVRSGTPASVIVADLDRLKDVNDSMGHRAGDELLRRIATTLRNASREPDIVARTGGDEFAVLAVDCGERDARILMARLAAALGEEGVEASIGVATRTPEGGLLAAVEEADASMLAAKRGELSDGS
jgi:diguanylate cyclase